MNILGLYIVIQLWSNSIGFITINKCNSLLNKKIKERGYYPVRNNSLYPSNEILLKVLKAFIPFYYCIEGIKLIEKSNKTNFDAAIKRKLENGEIKELKDLKEVGLSSTIFSDKGINYNRKKFSEHIPEEPYKSIPFEKRHTVEGDVVMQTISDEELGKYNGITPFVVEEKNQSKMNIKQLNEILSNNENFESFVLNTPLSELEDAYQTMGKVIEFRLKKEEDNSQILELKKEDKAA